MLQFESAWMAFETNPGISDKELLAKLRERFSGASEWKRESKKLEAYNELVRRLAKCLEKSDLDFAFTGALAVSFH